MNLNDIPNPRPRWLAFFLGLSRDLRTAAIVLLLLWLAGLTPLRWGWILACVIGSAWFVMIAVWPSACHVLSERKDKP